MITRFCEENNRLKMSIDDGETWLDLGPAEDDCLEELKHCNPCAYCSLADECCRCKIDTKVCQNNIQKIYQAIMNKWGIKWKYEPPRLSLNGFMI